MKMIYIFMDIIFLPLVFILVTVLGSASLHVPYDYRYLFLAIIHLFIYLFLVVLFRLYRYVWVYARVQDYLYLVFILIIDTMVIYSICTVVIPNPSLNASLIHLFIFFASVFVVLIPRFISVIVYEIKKKDENIQKANFPIKRTMIIGGGWTGNAVIKELHNGLSQYKPVCILDDDIQKKNMFIQDVPIVGNTNQVEQMVQEFEVETIIFAIPSCLEKDRVRILNQCVKTQKDIRVLPYTNKIVKTASILSQIQEVNIEDLLGRQQQILDDNEVKQYLQNRVCLISGGGGSIGSEICRQVIAYAPQKIIILDIYENNAYDIEQELKESFRNDIPIIVEICSVTDFDKCHIIFEKYRPQIVFHAAAHKHVPLMETVPEQAVKNNVGGTLVMAQLAVKFGVERFVLISTDKAVNPTNVMGATKRCCEMIIHCYAHKNNSTTHFCAVRFGNVLGSNGSVIPLFKKQIAHGGPVRVTDPKVTRFFITIPETVSLVQLTEEDSKKSQDKIFITHQPACDWVVVMQQIDDLLKAAYENNVELVLQRLKEIVPTFDHHTNGHDI